MYYAVQKLKLKKTIVIHCDAKNIKWNNIHVSSTIIMIYQFIYHSIYEPENFLIKIYAKYIYVNFFHIQYFLSKFLPYLITPNFLCTSFYARMPRFFMRQFFNSYFPIVWVQISPLANLIGMQILRRSSWDLAQRNPKLFDSTVLRTKLQQIKDF